MAAGFWYIAIGRLENHHQIRIEGDRVWSRVVPLPVTFARGVWRDEARNAYAHSYVLRGTDFHAVCVDGTCLAMAATHEEAERTAELIRQHA